MTYCVFDIETDGLLDKVSLIHCLCYEIYSEEGELLNAGPMTDYQAMKDLFKHDYTFIGHNIIRYDIPVLEQILGIDLSGIKKIDTLGLSWYLLPNRKSHGLEKYGEELGVAKPEIKDWENLELKDYIHRCEEDVKINKLLWFEQKKYLDALYDNNITRIVSYLNFKLDCLKVQEKVGIKLDIYLAKQTLYTLEYLIEEKITKLANIMPKQVEKTAPKKLVKADGSLSKLGESWNQLLKDRKLPLSTKVIYENGNPGSFEQLKAWLFKLGWKPKTFKVSKSTGNNVPQMSLPFGKGLCSSVKDLYTKEKDLVELEGLFVARHRLSVVKAFIENQKEGRIYSTAHGFTNTLRLQHSKPIVNLPSVFKEYGKEIRGCLTSEEGQVMIGSDISGLEDNTKQHYIYFFDPTYVNEMRVPGFDPHLDIALQSGMLTKEQVQAHKDGKEDYSKVRGKAKTVNFSATYGAGPAKIASTGGFTLEEAQKLHKVYWNRNKGIKLTEKSLKFKTVFNQKWLFNPVSNLWMFLKHDKDKFSTLNQSSGVYVFDTWLRHVRKALEPRGIFVCYQYHDELLITCNEEDKDFVSKVLTDSMKKTNEKLSLNVEISISIDVGNSYADCH